MMLLIEEYSQGFSEIRLSRSRFHEKTKYKIVFGEVFKVPLKTGGLSFGETI